MKNKKHTFALVLIVFITLISKLNASTFFSGYGGGKLNFGANQASKKYDPDLTLQAFFAGQFNFNQNMWVHTEISIDTEDLLSNTIFHGTNTVFQIDELSFIMRNNINEATNYFSAYMGTYDPVGSDIFLQRYFGIDPINSKITDSYLGMAGSILYPHFGLGISDVIKFYDQPLALGGYLYLNHEDKDYYVLNTDLRLATVLRYFTFDLACGLGAPLSNKYKDNEDIIVAIDKLYWHMGTTMLIGNNYTTSLFIQAGLYNASFTGRKNSMDWATDSIYILIEPRFVARNFHCNISLYSLPRDTVKKLLLVDDCIGFDVNLYNEECPIGSKKFTIGTHVSASVKNKTLKDIVNTQNFMSDGINFSIIPYISTDFLSGEMHAQLAIKPIEFKNSFGHGFSFDLGYRTRF